MNSRKRLAHAIVVGAETADGTYLAFGPANNLPLLLGWLADLKQRPPADLQFSLFDEAW